MRVDAMLPILPGQGSTDALAAAGGLNVPGDDPVITEQLARALATITSRREPIRGERDTSNLTRRQAGAMTAPFWGEAVHFDLDSIVPAGTDFGSRASSSLNLPAASSRRFCDA